MYLFCWRAGFKIRRKEDAAKLLNMKDESCFGHCDEEFYWHDEEFDYCIYPKMKKVGQRGKWARGNIFIPYLILENPVEVIWKNRKYINSQHFCEERRW